MSMPAIHNTGPADFSQPQQQPDWVSKENPQSYEESPFFRYVSPNPQRHILGLVGGNEVSLIKGNMVDLESDLRGTTRPLTHCAPQEHQPLPLNNPSIVRQNRRTDLAIDVRPAHLKNYQMWAYPSVQAPAPLEQDKCKFPHKY